MVQAVVVVPAALEVLEVPAAVQNVARNVVVAIAGVLLADLLFNQNTRIRPVGMLRYCCCLSPPS